MGNSKKSKKREAKILKDSIASKLSELHQKAQASSGIELDRIVEELELFLQSTKKDSNDPD